MPRPCQNNITYPWIPDQGDGTYCNPILCADYSDPDVIRVGNDFYLTASSFNCTPGLPILHSKDLVNWTIINHAIKNLPHPRYAEVQHGCGIWAPAMRYHANKFWIVFPMPDEGIYVITANDPAGRWSKPHLLLGGKGLIDPCPFWDNDGKAYLIHAYAYSRAGIRNKLHLRPMLPDATEVTGEGTIVAQIDKSLPALEGPKLHKLNGWYYISAPSGGVATGWQTIFRSRNIYGPYEEKIVLAQRGTAINGPHQGALVNTPDGEWWFLHFQDADLYGRIVHLQPVRWTNDWPLIGVDQDEKGIGKPALHFHKPQVKEASSILIPQTSDSFDKPHLNPQWQWPANHDDKWYSLTEYPGRLRLYAQFVPQSNFKKAGNLLLQKFPARQFDVETEVSLPAGQEAIHAGLIVMGNEYAALDVKRNVDSYQLRLLTTNGAGCDHTLSASSLRLRVKVGDGGECRFGLVENNGAFYQIGPAFHATPGRWIGAKVGLYCLSPQQPAASCHADFLYFNFL